LPGGVPANAPGMWATTRVRGGDDFDLRMFPTPESFLKPKTTSAPLARRRSRSCEWSDSNRHGVTHWYLNPAKTERFRLVTRLDLSQGGDFPSVFNELSLFPTRFFALAFFAKSFLAGCGGHEPKHGAELPRGAQEGGAARRRGRRHPAARGASGRGRFQDAGRRAAADGVDGRDGAQANRRAGEARAQGAGDLRSAAPRGVGADGELLGGAFGVAAVAAVAHDVVATDVAIRSISTR
jgi:hypothetical protein